MVPLGGTASYKEIAKKVGMSEHITRRLLRHAMTMRVFRERETGMVGHTKASRMLLNDFNNDWLTVGTHEMWPAAVKVLIPI